MFGLDHELCLLGTTHEVRDKVGAELVARKIADCIDEIKAVPPTPAIAEAKPGSVEKATADLKSYKAKQLQVEENKPATEAAETVSKPSTAKK